MPVEGTIARGHLSSFNYGPELEDYLLAGREAINPFNQNRTILRRRQKIISMFCNHCHGEFGAGGGTIEHPFIHNSSL